MSELRATEAVERSSRAEKGRSSTLSSLVCLPGQGDVVLKERLFQGQLIRLHHVRLDNGRQDAEDDHHHDDVAAYPHQHGLDCPLLQVPQDERSQERGCAYHDPEADPHHVVVRIARPENRPPLFIEKAEYGEVVARAPDGQEDDEKGRQVDEHAGVLERVGGEPYLPVQKVTDEGDGDGEKRYA